MFDTPTSVLAIALGWVAIGLTLSILMGRRGHDSFSWLILGTMLGPLAVVLAVHSWRHGETPRSEIVAEPTALTGPVDVLVGFDGSQESRWALSRVIGLLGPRLGRVTLATVIPFDCGWDGEQQAVAALEHEAAAMDNDGAGMGLEVVRGHPSHALTQLAVEGGYHLLAIGARGAGASKALMGSAASELARGSVVPVLLVGASADAHERPTPALAALARR